MKEGIFNHFIQITTTYTNQSHWEVFFVNPGCTSNSKLCERYFIIIIKAFRLYGPCLYHRSIALIYSSKQFFTYAVRPFIETFTEKFQGDLCRVYSLAQPHPVFVHYIIYFLRMPNQFSSREGCDGIRDRRSVQFEANNRPSHYQSARLSVLSSFFLIVDLGTHPPQ